MRFLITGGAGFIGRWVVKRLIEEGHHVDVIDNLSNSSRANLAEFEGTECLKNFVVGDVCSKEAVGKLFDNNPDVCIHLAAQINVQESINNPEKSFSVNVEGTRNILEAARKNGTKVAVVSTCMVYDTGTAMTETSRLNPRSPYAESKLHAEKLALGYWKKYQLPVTILRPFNTYGPFQRSDAEGGVVSIFVKNSIRNEPINIFGSGEQTRDLLYVEDCASFILEAALSGDAVGEVINAGTGREVSINQLAEMIANGPVKHVNHPHPESEITRLVCDYSKARSLLGWQPKTSLEDGIKKLRAWMLSHS
ncbi:MAG: GDP-mannose 4,6-dehydratase [Candidatus Aenigmarchaeota archaeon]|nr:GDP-mannose 4,6-dehydratase [Candidatus Aenigmarchaeota archaeon]